MLIIRGTHGSCDEIRRVSSVKHDDGRVSLLLPRAAASLAPSAPSGTRNHRAPFLSGNSRAGLKIRVMGIHSRCSGDT